MNYLQYEVSRIMSHNLDKLIIIIFILKSM